MFSTKLSKERQNFVKRHLLLADEAFCAEMKDAEIKLIQLARKELKFSIYTWDGDICRSLVNAYQELTRVRV